MQGAYRNQSVPFGHVITDVRHMKFNIEGGTFLFSTAVFLTLSGGELLP